MKLSARIHIKLKLCFKNVNRMAYYRKLISLFLVCCSLSTLHKNIVTRSGSPECVKRNVTHFLRLNEPKMSEAERQFLEGERADRSLFVQELLLSTLMHEESSSSDEDERRDFADFGAMGCVDIMPLDVALENLQLRESSSTGKEPPPPPL